MITSFIGAATGLGVVATVALILVEGVALTLTLAALAERYLFPIQQD
jgi:hypothetical protein